MNRIKELVELFYDTLTCVTVAIIGIAYFNVQFAARVFSWVLVFEFFLEMVKRHVRTEKDHVRADKAKKAAEEAKKN